MLVLVFVQILVELCSSLEQRVVVAGATGYIGRAVVKELVSRGVPTIALVRQDLADVGDSTRQFLKGAETIKCDALNKEELRKVIRDCAPTSAICCLASRDGLGKNSYAVDYGGGSNLLSALSELPRSQEHDSPTPHFVLLSAFCVGKPKLQFQFAKLKLEAELISFVGSATKVTNITAEGNHILDSDSPNGLPLVTHSIVRPTAYFKSLDGQIEAARNGGPIVYFGDGNTAANAISEKDLAFFLSDCALKPKEMDMLNSIRDVGGPDVPAVTKRQQGELIYDALGVPPGGRKFVELPLGIFTLLLLIINAAKQSAKLFRMHTFFDKCEDAAEIVRIVKYYAEEPMVATNEGEVKGSMTLKEHFSGLALNNGKLNEIDQYTTTAGVVELLLKNKYVKE